jgi:hypothetical protein
MPHPGSRWLGVFFAVLAVVTPLQADALQGLRADMTMSGGALDAPATGALYTSGSAARLELSMDGQSVIIVGDPLSGTMNILMPEQGFYMPLSAQASPVSVPPVAGYNPTDPCSTGEVTNCQSLGTESVNGYDTAVWQYDSAGETWTAWIATELSFPVRLVGEDGTTTDFTNVAMGPQEASLFEIPSDLQPMPGFGGFAGAFGGGGGGGRGGDGGGRGAGANAGPNIPGVPGFNAGAFGADPAALLAAANAYDPEVAAAWEAGDGYLVTVTVTASGDREGTLVPIDPLLGSTQNERETYSITYEATVPLNYGTPGVPASLGPRWQLVAGQGSDLGNAARIRLTGQSEYHSEGSFQWAYSAPGECTGNWSHTSNASADWDGGPALSDNLNAGRTIGFLQLTPDLQRYDLTIGVGTEGTETTDGVRNYSACENEPARSEPVDETGPIEFGNTIELLGLPLPAPGSTITGSQVMPLEFEFGDFSGELDATVEWTVSPI